MRTQKHILLLLLAFICFFPAFAGDAEAQYASVDFAQFANNFSCTVAGEPLGQLFDNGMARCDPHGMENLFTNAVCTYENIIDELLGKLFCGMQLRIQPILQAMLTLMVIFMAVASIFSITPFTAREGMFVLLKIGAVWGFATDPTLMIDLLYRGLMAFIQDTVQVVMTNFVPGVDSLSGPNGLFFMLDDIVADFVNKAAESQDPANPCNNGVLAMVVSFAGTVPMLAVLGVSMIFQFLLVFIQMVVGYFVAITGIMFLCAISPIFVSLALFKFTRSYFDKWVSYLLSFAIQIFVVAAFIGILISLDLGEDLRSLLSISRPYTVSQVAEGTRLPYRDWCSICQNPQEAREFGIECPGGAGAPALHPHSILQNPDAVRIFGGRLLKLLILAYLLRSVMQAVPSVAQALGGGGGVTVMGNDPFQHQKTGINAIHPHRPSSLASKSGASGFGGMRAAQNFLVNGRK